MDAFESKATSQLQFSAMVRSRKRRVQTLSEPKELVVIILLPSNSEPFDVAYRLEHSDLSCVLADSCVVVIRSAWESVIQFLDVAQCGMDHSGINQGFVAFGV